jgi:hypothetical protein
MLLMELCLAETPSYSARWFQYLVGSPFSSLLVTACNCKCYFDGLHNGGVYPPHHWHNDHVCTPKSWDHTVREEEKRVQRSHEYNKKKRKHEEVFQTYINRSWLALSDLDLEELGLGSHRGPPT